MHGYVPHNDVDFRSAEYNITQREFTSLLLPVLERKLRRTVPSLLAHPSILAHTIYQALAFDSALRDEGFDLPGTTVATRLDKEAQACTWEGISEIILGKKEWFEAWVEGEQKCKLFLVLASFLAQYTWVAVAMDQYYDIIGAPDAWLIGDEDSEENGASRTDRELRPTNSARRVKSLVEQVTGTICVLASWQPASCSRLQTAIHLYPSTRNVLASSSWSNCLSWSHITDEYHRLSMPLRHCRLPSCERFRGL